MDSPWYQRWSVWRRVLLGVAGVLALIPQFFVLADPQARLVAFAIAVINLALSFVPDQAVARVTGLKV